MTGRQTPPGRPQAPGGVAVPPALARPLLNLLVRALAREVREDGGTIPPGIATFLRALHTAIEPPGFADETPAGHPAIVEITAGEMAGLMGCSPQYVRRLCASGVLRARRAGRLWLIRTDGQGHHDDED